MNLASSKYSFSQGKTQLHTAQLDLKAHIVAVADDPTDPRKPHLIYINSHGYLADHFNAKETKIADVKLTNAGLAALTLQNRIVLSFGYMDFSIPYDDRCVGIDTCVYEDGAWRHGNVIVKAAPWSYSKHYPGESSQISEARAAETVESEKSIPDRVGNVYPEEAMENEESSKKGLKLWIF